VRFIEVSFVSSVTAACNSHDRDDAAGSSPAAPSSVALLTFAFPHQTATNAHYAKTELNWCDLLSMLS
jgi:hypothetical protein